MNKGTWTDNTAQWSHDRAGGAPSPSPAHMEGYQPPHPASAWPQHTPSPEEAACSSKALAPSTTSIDTPALLIGPGVSGPALWGWAQDRVPWESTA